MSSVRLTMNSSPKPGPSSSLTPRQRAVLQEVIRRGLKIPTPIHEQYGAYWRDPVPFFRQALKAEPWDLQERIARTVANHRRVAVRSCHHSGKTYVAGGLVEWFLAAFEPALVITTAPTERQVKDLLWHEIAQHHARS